MDSFHVHWTGQDGALLVPKIRVAGGYLLGNGVTFAWIFDSLSSRESSHRISTAILMQAYLISKE